MVETMNRLLRLSRQMVQELGREPRPEELAEKSGIPVDKIGEMCIRDRCWRKAF